MIGDWVWGRLLLINAEISGVFWQNIKNQDFDQWPEGSCECECSWYYISAKLIAFMAQCFIKIYDLTTFLCTKPLDIRFKTRDLIQTSGPELSMLSGITRWKAAWAGYNLAPATFLPSPKPYLPSLTSSSGSVHCWIFPFFFFYNDRMFPYLSPFI